MEWKDKVVIVSGATGALGSIMARELDSRGAILVLAGRDAPRLHDLASGLTRATTSPFDLGSTPSAPVEKAMATYGRVDGLVNAAGVVAFGPLEKTPSTIIEEIVETNLVGPLLLTAAALQHMEAGFVVNITGIVAEQPVAQMAPYVAAKAGLSAASVALARELRRRGTLVIDARPPHTETGLSSRPIFGEAPRMPVGLEPDRVVAVILKAIETGVREIPAASFVGSST